MADIPLVIGSVPEEIQVNMVHGTAFKATLEVRPGPWPVGTSLRLEIEGTSWPWTIAGALATLTIPAAAVSALPERGIGAQLWLDYGSGEFLWCSGRVRWHD